MSLVTDEMPRSADLKRKLDIFASITLSVLSDEDHTDFSLFFSCAHARTHSSVEFIRSYEPILSVTMCVHPSLCDYRRLCLPGILKLELALLLVIIRWDSFFFFLNLHNPNKFPLSRPGKWVQSGCCGAAAQTGRPEEGRQTWHIFVWWLDGFSAPPSSAPGPLRLHCEISDISCVCIQTGI